MRLTKTTTEAKLTFKNGETILVQERMTFDQHVENAKKIEGAGSIETLDGKIFQTI